MRVEPAAAEAGMMLHQPEVRRVFSWGSCPWIPGPWQWQAAQAPGRGGVDSDLCLHTGFLVYASSSLSVSWPSLGSVLIAAAHAHPWSSLRQCSESPLLVQPETIVSCLFSRSRLFPGLPPSYLWCTSTLQAVFTQATPVLSLGSNLQSQSLISQPPPVPAGEQTSLSGW